jgi:tetratricopeptide (TPR) repeat protein
MQFSPSPVTRNSRLRLTRFFLSFTRSSLPLVAVCLLAGASCLAQSSAKAKSPAAQSAPTAPPQPKPPALVDPAGPAISLQTSEALFDVAVALNACGYDNGLDNADPIRAHVRDEVNQATQQSAEARDDRDQLCTFINQHRLGDVSHDLAQYVSLALYLTPPPDLSPSVDEADMPPDSTQVIGIVPLLQKFARAAQLHVIWVEMHTAYEDEITELHDPLTKMIVDTNVYLKIPASTYDGRRFLVVLEPMLSSSETNARVYGADYVVVVSPSHGKIPMSEVRHTYLHYELEPLLYQRAGAMDRLLPFLKVVREAPLDFVYRSDIVSLVIESMIRATEARTMTTGVTIRQIPAGIDHAALEPVYRQHNADLQQDAAIREQSVQKAMTEGYVLTQYFYDQLIAFERSPSSIKDSIGEMVYGMPVDQELNRAKQVHFVEEGTQDVVRRAPVQPRGLDLAELDLIKGDAKTATTLSQTALKEHTADPARANFILARASLMSGDIDDAENAFKETVRLSNDPRLLAWSHIYLGRILDVEDKREDAMLEYKAALTVRDGQPDTRQAAEKGLKAPFALPKSAHSDDDDDDPPSKTPAPPASSQHPQ